MDSSRASSLPIILVHHPNDRRIMENSNCHVISNFDPFSIQFIGFHPFRISEIFEDSVEIEETHRAIQISKLFPLSSCRLFYEISSLILANRFVVQSEIVEIFRGAELK